MAPLPLLYLLDDNVEFCNEIKDLLEEDYSVEHYQNAEIFLQAIEKQLPQMAMIDLDLADAKFDGFSVIQILKTRPDAHLLPILMISGSQRDESLQRAFRSGIEDYILKPITPLHFKKKIEHVLFNTHTKIHTNALTGLPGIGIIEKEFDRRMLAQKKVSLAYLDLDYFKPFNDLKGVKAGDEAIVALAATLRDLRGNFGKEELFVGHLGGDDFFLLGEKKVVKKVVKDCFIAFDQAKAAFFTAEELKRGYYNSKTRQDKESSFKLLSLSCAYVHMAVNKKINFEFISEVAAQIKKKAKAIEGNSEAELELDAPSQERSETKLFQSNTRDEEDSGSKVG